MTVELPQAPDRNGTRRAAVVALVAFAAFALSIAIWMPFPSTFDELQHLSVVRSQQQAPALFADAGRYRVLDAHNPDRWTATRNYINHPALYYLTLAPLLAATDSVTVLRIANVVLALAALGIALWAGLRRLEPVARWPFAILAGAFPKAALIGGMINNDNLAALAGAIVFAGVLGAPGAAWWIAAGLALAGWSKLTALIALAAVVTLHQVMQAGWQPHRMPVRTLWPIAVGGAIGALPYIVNLLRSGHLLYINDAAFYVPPDARPVMDGAQFVAQFLRSLVMKWPAAEAHLPLLVALVTIAVPFGLAACAWRRRGQAPGVATAYLGAAAILLAIHLWFGWSAYVRIGDLTIAQPRYYGILWYGIAFAAAASLARLPRVARVLAIAVCLLPTIPGGALVTLVGG